MKFFKFNKKKAQKFHEEGQMLSDEGRDAEAIAVADNESINNLFDMWQQKTSAILVTLDS